VLSFGQLMPQLVAATHPARGRAEASARAEGAREGLGARRGSAEGGARRASAPQVHVMNLPGSWTVIMITLVFESIGVTRCAARTQCPGARLERRGVEEPDPLDVRRGRP